MKKVINNPSDVVQEMVQGMLKAYPQYIKAISETEGVVRTNDSTMLNKVGLVSGGGAGHEPAHSGFVGEGMLSAAVSGQVFTSPTPDQIYEAIKVADHGKGVFLIIKNYSGDVMNFDMAKDLAAMDDIDVDYIIVDDDIAVKDSLYTQGRRGVAGTIFMHKILGAAADQGASLIELKELALSIKNSVKTIAVALSAATVPEVGKPGFELAEDEIEFGVGIHSEPGYRREKLHTSNEMADELLKHLNDELKLSDSKKYAILVNGMGSTPLMEQFIFTNDVLNKLNKKGISPAFIKVGNFMTSLDMAGLSLTILELKEPKWLDYLNYSVKTISW